MRGRRLQPRPVSAQGAWTGCLCAASQLRLDHCHRADDEQATEVALTHLRDLPKPCLAARRMLPRHQTTPGRKVTAASEVLHVRCESKNRHRRDRPNSRNRCQITHCLIRLGLATDLMVQRRYPAIKIHDLLEKHLGRPADQVRECDALVTHQDLERLDMNTSLRSNQPELRKMPPQCIDRLCVLPHQKVAARNSCARDCCSTVFTATNRIVGRLTASAIASASAVSFFWRLTNGFTYAGGTSLTF